MAKQFVDLEKVWAFAVDAHDGQKDKSGEPYWTHLVQVWQNTVDLGGDVPTQAGAILHDVVEDTSYTLADLEGFVPAKTIHVVKALTKATGEWNPGYIGRVIEAGRAAQIVKLADLRHNTDPDRLATLPKYTQERLLNKYYDGIYRIESALRVKRTVTKEQVEKAKADYKKPSASTYTGKYGGAYQSSLGYGDDWYTGSAGRSDSYPAAKSVTKSVRAFALIKGDTVKRLGSVTYGKVEQVQVDEKHAKILFAGGTFVVVDRDVKVELT